LALQQVPNDDMAFKTETFAKDFDSSVFELPKGCSKQSTCPTLSVCTGLRVMGGFLKKA